MFPARAGMSPLDAYLAGIDLRVPRASGDEPARWIVAVLLAVCSPRERG